MHTNSVNQSIEDFRYSYTLDDQISTITSLNSSQPLPAATNASTADAANRIMQFGPASFSFNSLGQTTSKTDAEGLPSGLGDLTNAEVKQIQNVVDEAGRPLDVVGSAAKGERRGVGTDLPIGKGPGTRSDIDYTASHSNIDFFEKPGLHQKLLSIDQKGIIGGGYNPFIGQAGIRFEPGVKPFCQ